MHQKSESERAEATIEQSDIQRREEIDALNERAWQSARVDPDQGLPLAHEAETLSTRAPLYPDGIGLAKRTIAWCMFQSARYEQAVVICREALEILRRSGNRAGESNCLNNLGIFLQRQGAFADALESLEACLKIRRELDDRRGIAATLLNLGTIAIETGGFVEAIEYLLESLRISQEQEDARGCAGALTNLGNAYRSLGDMEPAREAHESALQLYRDLDDRYGQALALGNLGSVLGEQDQPEQALEYLRDALEIYESGGIEMARVAVLQNIGRAERELGRSDEALEHLAAALEICRRAGDRSGIASTQLELASQNLEHGALQQAGLRLHEALEIATELNARPLLWQIHKALADMLADEGSFEMAIDHLEQSNEILGELNIAETQMRVRGLQARHDVETARREGELHRLRNVELANALAELKRTQARVIHAERIASLGSLTAGVAHEINNPVNVIRTSIPSLRRDFEALDAFLRTVADLAHDDEPQLAWQRLRTDSDDHDVEYLLEEIRMLMEGVTRGSGRTGQILRGLSLFAPEQSRERGEHDLDQLIDDAIRAIAMEAPPGIAIERSAQAAGRIACSAKEIHQLLVNILRNAVQAIDGRGTVTVTATPGESMVEIAIRDSGCGMSPSVAGRIFEPFFTTRDVGSGVGLGLSIAYAIAGRHGGQISVSSTPGHGSTFVISLPLALESTTYSQGTTRRAW